MRALFSHVWLLLTLRHPATGLPTQWPPVLALIVLASVTAAVRWEVLYEPVMFARAIELFSVALAMFVWLLLISWISPRFASAYALISVGVDCISMLLGPPGLLGEGVGAALLFLQVLSLSRVGTLLWRRSRLKGRF